MATWKYHDGGRSKYFRGEKVGDCVTRAIAIATGNDYMDVYRTLREYQGRTARNGVERAAYDRYMREQGWTWVPTMAIGQGCTTHLRADELPSGRIVARVSKHMCAVIDGVIYDTYDPSRNGTRCVYGYWIRK